ncbi:hypothetical protein W97_03579, partial [Coniosporium apollinis CBS 100218]
MARESRSTAKGKARYYNRIRRNTGCEIEYLIPNTLQKKDTDGKAGPLATAILQTLAVASFVEKDPETLRGTIAQAVESKTGRNLAARYLNKPWILRVDCDWVLEQCCQRNGKTVEWAKDRAKKHKDYKPYLGAADSD